MSKEVVTTDTRKRKDKYNARVARFRPVKNLLLWLSGVVSGLVLLVIALVVLPVGTILGAAGVDVKETIGEENGKKSIYGFVTGIKDIAIDDVPFLQNAIGGFTSPIAQFNEFTEVEEGETVDPAAADFVAALYYYKNASGEFCRAFDNEKNYVSGVNASTKLYYANISAVAVSDLPAVLTASLRNMKVVDLISGVSGDSEMTGSIAKILEDTKVSELGSFDISGVELSAVLSSTNGAAVSEQLKKLLSDLAGAEYEEITIGALTSDFNVSKVHISTVIENNGDNAAVVRILTDAIGEGKAYDDITVEDFGSLDLTNVKLSTVLGDESELDANLLSILKDATGGTEYADMTVKNLTSGLSFDSVHLSAVLGNMDDNSDLVKILKDATGKDSFSAITVNDLKALETNNVKLSSVLQVAGNEKIYEILLSGYVLGVGETAPTEETLTIGGLSKFSINGIKLSAVLDLPTAENAYANEKIYEILLQGTGAGSYEDISISSLSVLNTGNIKLSAVLDLPTAENAYANEKIYEILLQGTGAGSYEDISISSLSVLDTGNIKLSAVLGDRSVAGDKLAGILEDCCAGKNYADIKVSDLAGLDTDNIKLSSVLDYDSNQNIFNILAEGAVEYSGDVRDIKISDINGFNVSKVKLKTVIPSSDNKILSALLADESVTVGNAGDKINALKVSDIYDGVPCFVENSAGTGKYYKLVGTEKETFILTSKYNSVVDGIKEEGKTYDISPSAGMWFFMFYARNSAGTDTEGYGIKYEATDITFGEMETKVVEVSAGVQNATIRELVSCGLVADPEFTKDTLYVMTLPGMFEAIKAIP